MVDFDHFKLTKEQKIMNEDLQDKVGRLERKIEALYQNKETQDSILKKIEKDMIKNIEDYIDTRTNPEDFIDEMHKISDRIRHAYSEVVING